MFVEVCADGAEVASELAERVAAASASAIAERGAFSIALSGGSLVKALASLAGQPAGDGEGQGGVDFARWHVFWADERCVPLDHADSNARGALEAFLGAAGVPAAQVHTIDGALSPAEEAARYEAKMRSAMASGAVATNEGWAEEGGDVVPPMPRLDLILLGMGPDGHCASLFPGHPLMEVKDRAVAYIEDSPKPPPGRITLTLPCLCAAREVIFVAAGEGKAQVVADVICEGERDGVPLPAAMVEPVDGNLIYLIDEAGAALIE